MQEELTKRGLDTKWNPLKGKKELVDRLQVGTAILHAWMALPFELALLMGAAAQKSACPGLCMQQAAATPASHPQLPDMHNTPFCPGVDCGVQGEAGS